MGKIYRYNNCIVCGQDNPIGFKIDFVEQDGHVSGKALSDGRFEGYGGILHGGIISTLLDEAMIKALFVIDVVAVTMELKVRFRKPVKIGQELTILGYPGEVKSRAAMATGKVVLADGTIAAEGSGKFFILDGDKKEKMIAELN